MREKVCLYFAFLVLVIFSLLQVGCVSISPSPSPRLYMPEAITRDETVQKFSFPEGSFIGIGPVRVPEYMSRPQMVTRGEDGLLNIAQFERWAEPIDAAILRLVDEDLVILLPGANTVKSPWNPANPLKYQVAIDVIQMDSDLGKNLTLIVRWTIFDGEGRETLYSKRSELVQPILPHDYLGLSRALGSAVAKLSSEIAERLSILAKEAEGGE